MNGKSTTQSFETSSATTNPTGTSKDGASNIGIIFNYDRVRYLS